MYKLLREAIKELKEIKKLLQVIASNQEQKTKFQINGKNIDEIRNPY